MSAMAHNFTLARLANLRRSTEEETWEVAIVEMPAVVREDPEHPYRPVFAVCLSTHGGMATSDVYAPEELSRSCMLEAVAAFAVEPHNPGQPTLDYLPPRVRVPMDDDPFVAHLIEAMTALGITVERAPELPIVQAMLENMHEHVARTARAPRVPALARVKGMTLPRIRAFAEAAARFYDAAPWEHYPDEILWEIHPVPTTRAMRHCIVTGVLGEQFGLAFVPSRETHAEMAFGPGRRLLSTLWSVMLDEHEVLPDQDVRLWYSEQLPLFDAPLIPFPIGFTKSGRILRPSPDQLTLMEGLLRGFATIGAKAASSDRIAFKVRTFDGPQEFVLTAAG
ncbi:MAG: hypothetical protein KDA22_08805 [Phycisphaerales bacterium]|nr:hypothetical protein [Phycisphaerales bacterium]